MGQTLTISCGDVRGQHLVSAIREGDVDCLQRMFDDNPKRLNNQLFFDHVTPLHIAASCGRQEVLMMLLKRGANPNALNRHGQTPLMLACKSGRWTCVDPLLGAGASILAFDYILGRSCLHYACRGGHAECVRKLLDSAQRGPVALSWGLARFVNLRDRRGTTCLHIASRMGHAAVLRLLLKSGGIVDCVSTTIGNGPCFATSPIHHAARGGSLECVRELLAWGADRYNLDSAGYTPFGIATKYSNTACAAVLNPDAAEPLVWPSPWKFMSEGELEPEAKTVLEAALAAANNELEKEIAVQSSQEVARKSSTTRRKRPTLASILALPEQRTRASPIADISLEADTAMHTETTPTDEARLSVVDDPPSEAPTEKARISVVGALPSGDLSCADPNAVVNEGGVGVQEVCCICFEQFCTIEVMECGHQMCATCTLSLCCTHSKPNPAFPYTSTPSCPFCRHSIGHLILARPKSKQTETKEKSKLKLRLSRFKSKHSRDESGGKGSLTGSILSMALGGSKRLGASGRVADAEWLDRCGSRRLGASGRVADAEWLDRCGSKRSGASGRIADAEWLDRCGSKKLGTSSRIADAADPLGQF